MKNNNVKNILLLTILLTIGWLFINFANMWEGDPILIYNVQWHVFVPTSLFRLAFGFSTIILDIVWIFSVLVVLYALLKRYSNTKIIMACVFYIAVVLTWYAYLLSPWHVNALLMEEALKSHTNGKVNQEAFQCYKDSYHRFTLINKGYYWTAFEKNYTECLNEVIDSTSFIDNDETDPIVTEELCASLSGRPKGDCFTSLATEKIDTALCDKIAIVSTTESHSPTFLQELVYECYTALVPNITSKSESISLCETTEGYPRGQCFTAVAIQHEDYSVCELVGYDEEFQSTDHCLNAFNNSLDVSKQIGEEVCALIQNNQDDCYFKLATKLSDPSVCSNIYAGDITDGSRDASFEIECYYQNITGMNNKNDAVGICNLLEGVQARMHCFYSIVNLFNDFALCGAYKNVEDTILDSNFVRDCKAGVVIQDPWDLL